MMTSIDYLLDRTTMYRLVLYVLLGLIGIAAVLSYFGLLAFSPLALLISAGFLVLMCWAANTMLSWAFNVPPNVESAAITGLILSLIIDPPRAPSDLEFLGWAAILAMAAKYLLAFRGKHFFNPAAIAVVITAFVLREPASWWVGTGSMLPAVLIGGYLIVRKMRLEDMVVTFVIASVVTVCLVSLVLQIPIVRELQQLLVASPLFFVASVMLTEPLTAPPTRDVKRIYALMVGFLIVPQIHVGSLYSTPELALVAGNVFSYLTGPKQRVALKLRKKNRLAPDVVDFVFAPSRPLAFAPGQFIECTLSHPGADSRGNRRYFTIASSPTEDNIRLGVRFYQRGSTFKRALYRMDARTPVLAGQVAGDFTLPKDRAQKLVFIAGGIGITPYRSMLKYLVDTKQRRDIILIYANRTVNDIVYKDVLSDAQTKLGVKTVLTLTDTSAIPRNWPGYRGRITDQMIRDVVPDYAERVFYLSGPPDMVKAHDRALRDLGVQERHIKKDFFPGLV